MTIFLRLLADTNKDTSVSNCCASVRAGRNDERIFEISPDVFNSIPGAPFSYWVGESVRRTFSDLPPFEGSGRTVKIGMKTGDDFRFLQLWWEGANELRPYAKGGASQGYYADIPTSVKWHRDGAEVKAFVSQRLEKMFGNSNYEFWISNEKYYGKAGITWSLRSSKFLPRSLPRGAIFSVRGYCAFVADGDELASIGLMNGAAFDYIFKSALGRFGFPEFIVGILQKLPWPNTSEGVLAGVGSAARRAWALKRTLDTVEEASHAFLLPAALRARLGDYDPPAIEAELACIQAEIDNIAFDLYGFSNADRAAAQASTAGGAEVEEGDADDDGDDDTDAPIDVTTGLLSWAVGVAFGRFDWRLATGEREAPPEPDPFDPLPAKSPGMLPDGAEPFHAHAGILVDDACHPHDLARLVEEVLGRVEAPVPADVRRWLQRDCFAFHLQRYSKSRRKAPIYWPLATASGGYTLWLYYPSLSSQTLYTAINDFIEPKLRQVGQEAAALRGKTGRSRDEDKALEALQTLELELIDLRDTLLQIAATWRPSHDDGVQITAAPLWPLFRHKPWQKVLKDTWAKLEKGDYDWSHLAMSYWPDRVRDKCKTEKSLAIAHDLENLYEEPPAAPKKARGKKKSGGEE